MAYYNGNGEEETVEIISPVSIKFQCPACSENLEKINALIASWLEVANKSDHHSEYREGCNDCARDLGDLRDSWLPQK